MPDEVIISIAYNTTTFGYAPIGPSVCSATPQGCGYDSLNVGFDANYRLDCDCRGQSCAKRCVSLRHHFGQHRLLRLSRRLECLPPRRGLLRRPQARAECLHHGRSARPSAMSTPSTAMTLTAARVRPMRSRPSRRALTLCHPTARSSSPPAPIPRASPSTRQSTSVAPSTASLSDRAPGVTPASRHWKVCSRSERRA